MVSSLEPSGFALDVLEVIEQIPAGRVMSYGDIAEYLGTGGPRRVGWVLSHFGSDVAWWRVLRSDGVLLPGHETQALAAYRRERTPLRADGQRVDMRRARWDGS